MIRMLILAFVLTFGSVWPALADSPAPDRPYKVEVGEYVFVMLLPHCETALVDMSSDRLVRNCIQSTTGEYFPVSGLYRNDGSLEPLWTVEWYASNVLVSNDGVHLVRMGPWAWRSSYETLAAAFYLSGELLATYTIADLVHEPSDLPHSVSHFTWRREVSLDDEKKQLFISTLGGERYLFNLLDGQITESQTATQKEYAVLVRYRKGRAEALNRTSKNMVCPSGKQQVFSTMICRLPY